MRNGKSTLKNKKMIRSLILSSLCILWRNIIFPFFAFLFSSPFFFLKKKKKKRYDTSVPVTNERTRREKKKKSHQATVFFSSHEGALCISVPQKSLFSLTYSFDTSVCSRWFAIKKPVFFPSLVFILFFYSPFSLLFFILFLLVQPHPPRISLLDHIIKNEL